MKSMKVLIRVKQREMDALKRQQGILEERREEAYRVLDALAMSLQHELKTATTMPEMAHFFGDYASVIKQRQEQIHGHVRLLETELEKLAAHLRERFSEMKKYELALKAHERRKAEALRKREGQEMDELGIRGYVRKDAV